MSLETLDAYRNARLVVLSTSWAWSSSPETPGGARTLMRRRVILREREKNRREERKESRRNEGG